jgi:IS5 family transposase
MERKNAQPTFIDLTVADLGGPRAAAFFERCQKEIPFAQLAASVADLFEDASPSGGAPHWPVETMLRIVFLQKCFALSDPAAEEMLMDRISFRRFVGLSFHDKTPDHSTLSVFRKRLREHGHGSTLFEKTLEILRSRGLVLNTGTLIDAAIIEAPLGSKRADGSSTTDPCATKTLKSGRVYHGYRAHVASDRNGIITDYVYDTAATCEHVHFDHLARKETRAVFADSGCRSRERLERLRRRGAVPALCHRRVRGQKELTPQQRRLNRLIAPIRAFVEHPFAWIKLRLNHRRARYRGLKRNALDFALSAMACNFCRSFTLRPALGAAPAT